MVRKSVTMALAGVRPGGCLQPHMRGLAEHLVGGGYAVLSTRSYLRAAAHLGRWMDRCGIPLTGLNEEVVARFSRHRCRCSG
jgi:hypothetical protein